MRRSGTFHASIDIGEVNLAKFDIVANAVIVKFRVSATGKQAR